MIRTRTPPRSENQGRGSEVASLVLGIVSTVLALLGWLGVAGLILGLIGTTCGIIGLVQAGRALSAGRLTTMRSFGYWLSLIGMIASIVLVVYIVVVLVWMTMSIRDIYDSSRSYQSNWAYSGSGNSLQDALANELDALGH